MTAPSFFVSIILSLFLGIILNIVIYKIFKKNLLAFLLSLLGIAIVVWLLKKIINLMLPIGPTSLGAALALGIGAVVNILIGIVCYILASLGTSLYRRYKSK